MRCKIKSVPMANNGLTIEDNQYEVLSDKTINLKGKSHENGGTLLDFKGQTVEAEAGEPVSMSGQGDLIIWGNLEVPGTNKKFKNYIKDLAKEESKANKQLNKGTDLINEKDPYDSYQAFGFNSGRVLADAALQKDQILSQKKDLLAEMQNSILKMSEMSGKSPEKITSTLKNGGIIKAKEGLNIKNPNDRDYIVASLRLAAMDQGVNPDTIERLAYQESGYRPGIAGPKTKYGQAFGIMQMLPSTAKKYGITEEELKSTNPKDVEKVISAGVQHFKELQDSYGGDEILALAAYNGGPKAVNFVKEQTGKKDLTGEDWMNYMEERKINNPTINKNAYQNQTYEYISNIKDLNNDTFYNQKGPSFRKNYYDPEMPRLSPNIDDYEESTSQMVPESPQRTPTDFRGITSYDEPQNPNIPNLINTSISNTPQSFNPIRNRLGVQDFMGEIAALADRPDYVEGQQYNPIPYTPYQVSFQDQLNRNSSTFRSIAQQLTNNPEALSVIAAQKYDADSRVLGDQFRTNQGIQNQITNQNVQLFNQAELQNIQLRDQQQDRQARAKGITEDRKQQALTSISNKIGQNRAVNNSLRMYENFSSFKGDQNGQLNYVGPDPINLLNFYGQGESQGNNYQRTVTTRDATGNIRNIREYDPSEIDKNLQFWQLMKQRGAASGL